MTQLSEGLLHAITKALQPKQPESVPDHLKIGKEDSATIKHMHDSILHRTVAEHLDALGDHEGRDRHESHANDLANKAGEEHKKLNKPGAHYHACWRHAEFQAGASVRSVSGV